LAVAEFLAAHPRVAWVRYPGLADDKYHALARKYTPKRRQRHPEFGIKGGVAAGARSSRACSS
jgi:O-acetylhomoserine (thiol)-lyase